MRVIAISNKIYRVDVASCVMIFAELADVALVLDHDRGPQKSVKTLSALRCYEGCSCISS